MESGRRVAAMVPANPRPLGILLPCSIPSSRPFAAPPSPAPPTNAPLARAEDQYRRGVRLERVPDPDQDRIQEPLHAEVRQGGVRDALELSKVLQRGHDALGRGSCRSRLRATHGLRPLNQPSSLVTRSKGISRPAGHDLTPKGLRERLGRTRPRPGANSRARPLPFLYGFLRR